MKLHIPVSNADVCFAPREADVALRLTTTPTDTLIGKRMLTVVSTIYGSRDYPQTIRHRAIEPKWIGVNCCLSHTTWAKQYCDHPAHNFYSSDTLLTMSAIGEGPAASSLSCFMGDAEPLLERYAEPDPQHDLGL